MEEENQNYTFLYILTFLFICGVVGVLIYLSIGELSTRETGLLSTILTILSVLAAWILSHLYAANSHKRAISDVKSAHQENLQTYALKAAEKVNNLSDQLNKLSIYIEEELETNTHETIEETLRAREERLYSTVQMIGMLKSVNDTSLSDWQGVIGEQLEEQREEREEREEELRELVSRLEDLWSKESDRKVDHQLADLQRDVRVLMAGVGGVTFKAKPPRKNTRRDVTVKCPECSNELNYRQRARINSNKSIDCAECKTKLISLYSKEIDEFELIRREPVAESFQCSACTNEIQRELDNFPSTSIVTKCDHCENKLKIVRLSNRQLKVTTSPGIPKVLTDDMLDQIKNLLPEQPWPKDTHKDIAAKLDISPTVVSKATRILINKGEFKEQINGKLYELVEVGVQ